MRGKTLVAVVLAATLATAASPRPALADNRVTGEAQQLVKEGASQYQAGDYARAAATLQQAYALKPAPRLLFNIARALEKAGNSSDALTYYERYLEAGETEPDLVRKSQDAIDRLRPSVAEPTPAPPPPAPVTPPPAPPAPSPAASAPPDEARGEEPRHTLSWVLIGGGAGVAAAGLGVAVLANATASQEKSSTDPTVKPGLRDAAYTRATIADVLMGVGVAAAATGLVLRFTAERPRAGLAIPSIRVGAGSVSASWELGP